MGVGKVSRWEGTSWMLYGGYTWGRLLGKTLAKAFAFLLACDPSRRRSWAWALRVTLLRLGRVGDTEEEQDRKVRGQTAWRGPEVFMVKHVATMFVSSPRVRAPRHDEKARALFV